MLRQLASTLSFLTCCSIAHAAPPLAANEEVRRFATRENVELPVLVSKPEHAPRAVVLLFAGGGGQIALSPTGIGKSVDNFTVRTRELYAEAEMVAVVVDAPSDHTESLSAYRASRAEAEDVAALVAWANGRWPGAPVWLVSTSRGTISAANAAVRGVDVQGIVLTSSVTTGETEKVTLLDLDLESIAVPVLLVHHRKDRCPASPLRGSRDVKDQLQNARRELVDGGDEATGSVCSPESAHGYVGLDAEVVGRIVRYITEH